MLTVIAAFAGLAFAGSSAARPPGHLTVLGVRGNAARFQGLTGQQSSVVHQVIGWEQGRSWGAPLAQLLGTMGPTPMLGLNTTAKWPSRAEAITPKQIALGAGDGYLMAVGAALAAHGGTVYLRPFGEMNGSWNVYCAYTPSGAIKPGHETSWFRKAFARLYLIVHGGSRAEIDAQLAGLGLPRLGGAGDPPANPLVRVIWNPQGFGNPNIPGNSAQAYYPGDAFVDVVGDDLYDIRGKAEWKAAEALYRAHPGKPFAFPEWGLWGVDDPAFIRRMGAFVRSHRRTELLAYFESAPGSIFDLASKPRSRAAYRSAITTLG
jgi:hypothetical protein